MASVTKYIFENTTSTVDVTDTTGIDTTGMTVGVYLTRAGVTVEVGTADGAAPGTDIEVPCNWGLVSPGKFFCEVIADRDYSPLVMAPNETYGNPIYVIVIDTKAVT